MTERVIHRTKTGGRMVVVQETPEERALRRKSAADAAARSFGLTPGQRRVLRRSR